MLIPQAGTFLHRESTVRGRVYSCNKQVHDDFARRHNLAAAPAAIVKSCKHGQAKILECPVAGSRQESK